jgi:hypothetical protein
MVSGRFHINAAADDEGHDLIAYIPIIDSRLHRGRRFPPPGGYEFDKHMTNASWMKLLCLEMALCVSLVLPAQETPQKDTASRRSRR